MAEDWLELPSSLALASAGTERRHLQALRTLLERDYLARADWHGALRDLAEMVAVAVEADRTMVALWHGQEARWSAVTRSGEQLEHDDIARCGSRSTLERVQITGEPILTTGEGPIDLDSESIREHHLEWFLVVPLYWWDVNQPALGRQFGGCLYAHRTAGRRAFSAADVEIVLDIARLAQPTLNMLRCLEQVQQALETSRDAIETLRAANAREYRLGAYQTFDPWFARDVLEPLKRVSRADKVNILLLGPTGAGKTHLAEAYHHECPRSAAPFVVLDCAQVTSVETLSAELFGYAADSGYANAPRGGRPGKAQLAHRGTLFIDEIGCLPVELQQKLLRLIERGEYSPLGSSEIRSVDLQILSATNENLAGMLGQGRFREDLYWRLSDITVSLPPLSERPADIPQLARFFLRRARERIARAGPDDFDDAALYRLLKHDWAHAGNVRGLERTVFRSVLLAPAGIKRLEAGHLKLQQLEVSGSEQGSSRGGRAAFSDGHPEEPTASLDAHSRVAGGGPGSAEEERQGKRNPPGSRSNRQRAGSPRLEEVKAAIHEHGYASAAARALGISYRELTWQLHKVGLTVRDVLAERY